MIAAPPIQPSPGHVSLRQEARRLRDSIYGVLSTDAEWFKVSEAWVDDLPWLREQAARKMKTIMSQ